MGGSRPQFLFWYLDTLEEYLCRSRCKVQCAADIIIHTWQCFMEQQRVQTIYKKLHKILQIEILNLQILDWGSPLSNDLILELHNIIWQKIFLQISRCLLLAYPLKTKTIFVKLKCAVLDSFISQVFKWCLHQQSWHWRHLKVKMP